ncbi:MAG: hypothetical protein LR000_01965 [Candidatus Pacebacteria bacterium]|nr:hypothetical protein [Candidatus Paceibacterota bacterium]
MSLNKNCWLVQGLGYPPAKRCRYCQFAFFQCPFFQYGVISLIVIGVIFGVSWVVFKDIPNFIFFITFFCIFIYGYFFNRATLKIIEADFEIIRAKQELEKKVKERTKELADLTKHLEEKVKEKTKELQKQKEVLEKEVAQRTRELQDLNERLEEEIKKRTKELQEKIAELEQINKLAVGRELKMVEMKEEIQRLRQELKKCQEKLKNK